ncbi:exosortase family protein XrtF [Aureibaculum sp. 2210JD6-5]|uniref:exosortase family protein XrtF n=1 Tax=Aureibaculum sp. 2210JD6-5 TaxID=3103957 RepID=UPI002AADC73D|nr:exosortase family protein XrtF [Aureibaculum sp. 2210JD6-5]MDY7395325.1 exosortase family protein XrtF [Aureibaculum sp. 2210JD6-5]
MKKRKTIIRFLLKFFVTYFILVGIYSIYLKQTQQKGDVFSCAPITKVVAEHSQWFGEVFGYNVHIEQHESELSMKFFVNGNYIARIVEGCNSISVIILFITFIIAFSGSLKATIIFGIVGTAFIYVVNIARVFILSMLMFKYPEYKDVLHNLLFPAIIYGAVFLLWIIWVKRFSYLKKPKNE